MSPLTQGLNYRSACDYNNDELHVYLYRYCYQPARTAADGNNVTTIMACVVPISCCISDEPCQWQKGNFNPPPPLRHCHSSDIVSPNVLKLKFKAHDSSKTVFCSTCLKRFLASKINTNTPDSIADIDDATAVLTIIVLLADEKQKSPF